VNTKSGTAALASDCCHLFRNVREDTTSCVITDMIAWLESFQRLKKAVSSEDLIFPGHDAEMITRFPNVAAGVSRLVG
jgi:glyoxylase-like metal-dependent hydrolase (beta-lactamase superfamily II)